MNSIHNTSYVIYGYGRTRSGARTGRACRCSKINSFRFIHYFIKPKIHSILCEILSRLLKFKRVNIC